MNVGDYVTTLTEIDDHLDNGGPVPIRYVITEKTIHNEIYLRDCKYPENNVPVVRDVGEVVLL